MKLRSLNRIIGILILIFFSSSVLSEEQIDIWNKEKKEKSENLKSTKSKEPKTEPIILNNARVDTSIKIEDEPISSQEDEKIFGIYDPAENGFNLNMWSKTSAEDVRLSIKRLNKIKLSKKHQM